MKKELNILHFILITMLFSLIFINIVCSNKNSLDNWIGDYYYIAKFPHTTDYTASYFIVYEITIYDESGEYFAEINNNGWFLQTSTLARVTGNENSINITFIETLPQDSLYGITERYENNELLIEFQYVNSELQTYWWALRYEHPTFFEEKNNIFGVFFQKE